MSMGPSYRHVVMLVAATGCWGCGTVISKHALDRGVAPMTLLVLELTASCSLLLVALLLMKQPWSWSPQIRRLATLGILNPGLAYALGLLGLVTVSASMAVLLWATEPILIMVLAVLILREQIAAATLAAMTATMLGLLLVVYAPGAAGDPTGIALTLGAVGSCAGYTVLTRRLLLDDSSLTVVLLQQVVALAFAVSVVGTAVAVGITDLGMPPDNTTWALAAASGTLYYGLAFWLFVGGLRGVPASFAGLVLPLTPIFGLTLAGLLGDRLTNHQWIGAIVVLLTTAAAVATQLRHQNQRT